jgi:hypothetical protein
MIVPRQKRIFTSVRPARVAVFINETDPHWQSTCARIIEFFSAAWGGASNIIVPTGGNALKDPFWDILDVYDPDYLFLYYYSGDDLRLNEPEKYEQWVDSNLQQYISGGPVSDVDSARRQIDQSLRNAPRFREPEANFQQRLIKRLAPLHVADHAFEASIGVGSTPRFPLTPLIKLLPNVEHATRVVTYEPKYGSLYPLWIASVTGSLADEFKQELNGTGIQHEIIPAADYAPMELFINPPDAVMRRAQRQAVTPFELANIDTGLGQRVGAGLEPSAVAMVAGQNLADFCLYYSLSRLRYSVTWLPLNFLQSQSESGGERVLLDGYVDALKDLVRIRQRQSDPQYVLMSATLDDQTLNTTLQALDQTGYGRFEAISESCTVAPELKKLLRDPLRLYERDNAYRPTALTVSENGQFDFFDTPRPKNFLRLDPYENRWIAEVNIPAHQLPRNHRLGEWVVRHPMLTSNGARTCKSGLAYFCPNAAYFGGDIDTSLVRPSVVIPDALQMFEHLFQLEGYEATVSDKGFYERDTIEKFGSLATLAMLLRPNATREMLLKFLDHIKPTQGVRDEGSVLNDRRRYLNLPAVSNFLGNEAAAQKMIEVLVSAHVLHRGFIFKCQFCRNADWFSIDEVSQNFKCKRCGRSQGISSANYWYGTYEPGWFYKLDEIVYQFLRHNGYVALLALDHLRRKAEESFLYTPDIELTKRGAAEASMELDILCVADGAMMIGEAKKEDRLGTSKREEIETVRRYNRLAEQIGAEALVFATFADTWSDNTQKYIGDNVRDRDLIFLTRSELLEENA